MLNGIAKMKLNKLKIFSKITIFVLTICACLSASGESTNLYCSGVTKGRGIADSPYDFDLIVDSKTGAMSGFPSGLFLACLALNAEKLNAMKCSIDEISANCSCQNYGITKKFSLSRRSGILIVDTFAVDKNGELVDDMTMQGKFICKKIKDKVF